MLILRGAPALSAFRKTRMHATLRENVPSIGDVCAEYLYFVDLDGDLPEAAQQTLEALLQYRPKTLAATLKGQPLLVVPRPGTISPWSSKATDIARNVGLTGIRRIERGIIYYLESASLLGASERPGCCLPPRPDGGNGAGQSPAGRAVICQL